MQTVALLDDYRHAHIIGYLLCPQFSEPKPIHFLIDTGCTTTTILSDDVTRLNINCSNLSLCSSPTSTANSQVYPYLLPNIGIILKVKHAIFNLREGFRIFRLDYIHCMSPTNPQLLTQHRIISAYSLLGMDVLGIFKKWQYTNRELILKT